MIDFPAFPFMPPDLSTHGHQIDALIWWVHIVMAILFVGWGGFFIYTLIRFREGKNPKADHAGVKSHFSTYHEVAIVIVECVLLFALAIPLWANWVEVGQTSEHENPVEIHIVAQQFAWNAHYPGPDGKFGRLVASEINDQSNRFLGLDRSGAGADDIQLQNLLFIPVNRPVVIQVTSKDVIHSFSLPVMRVKQDAIPGMSIPLGFQAKMTSMEFKKQEFADNPEKYATVDEQGNVVQEATVKDVPDFEIACAQLCGKQHNTMVGKFYIVSEADWADLNTLLDFLAWGKKFRRGQWDQLKEGGGQ